MIEYVIIEVMENPIQAALMEMFNMVYDTTIRTCQNNEQHSEQCLTAANNTKFAVELSVILIGAMSIAALITRVMRAVTGEKHATYDY